MVWRQNHSTQVRCCAAFLKVSVIKHRWHRFNQCWDPSFYVDGQKMQVLLDVRHRLYFLPSQRIK